MGVVFQESILFLFVRAGLSLPQHFIWECCHYPNILYGNAVSTPTLYMGMLSLPQHSIGMQVHMESTKAYTGVFPEAFIEFSFFQSEQLQLKDLLTLRSSLKHDLYTQQHYLGWLVKSLLRVLSFLAVNFNEVLYILKQKRKIEEFWSLNYHL